MKNQTTKQELLESAFDNFKIDRDNFEIIYKWFSKIFRSPESDRDYFFEWVGRYQKGMFYWFGNMTESIRAASIKFLIDEFKLNVFFN